MDNKFRDDLISIGILSYREQETLFEIAKRCAKTSGIPMAGGFAVLGAGMGSVAVPGLGSVPGWIIGALAGMITGTITCTSLNASMRQQLRDFASSYDN